MKEDSIWWIYDHSYALGERANTAFAVRDNAAGDRLVEDANILARAVSILQREEKLTVVTAITAAVRSHALRQYSAGAALWQEGSGQ